MTARINYDDLVADYARHRTVHPGVLQELIDHAGIEQRSPVVEIGSGTGNYVIAVHEATGCHAARVEPLVAMMHQSRIRTSASAIAWLEGRAEALPLKDNAVDVLFSVDVIHQVENRIAFFRRRNAHFHRVD